MEIADSFKREFISSMSAMKEILDTHCNDGPANLFLENHNLLIKNLASAFDSFSTTVENVHLGQLVFSYSTFMMASIEALKDLKLTHVKRLEKTLFIASAIYLASTREIEDVLDVREE